MSYHDEKEKISDLIREALRVLVSNGVSHNMGFAVEGGIRVITDTKEMFEVDINEVVGITNDELTTLKQELNIQQDHVMESTVKTGNLQTTNNKFLCSPMTFILRAHLII